MILSEYPYKGNKNLIRTYSDNVNKVLLQNETGAIYNEAVDIFPHKYTYSEIDKQEAEDDDLFA